MNTKMITKEKIIKKIESIPNNYNNWKYQTVPSIGYTGIRGIERFKLLPEEKIKDSIVIDFGCNFGQSCIEISKMNAKEVWGIDRGKENLEIANDIKKLNKIKNINFIQADFNKKDFVDEIEKKIPYKCDYSIFFSVYTHLSNKDEVFNYIINKTKENIFFETNPHKNLEYYENVFKKHNLIWKLLGRSEKQKRYIFMLYK